MLPLVLGGMALAAVGYGVKEYCENEGCPWDEEEVFVRKIGFADLEKKKSDVYVHSYVPLAKCIDEIQGKNKHTPQEHTILPKEESISRISSEIQHYIESYHTLLHTFEKMLDNAVLILERTQEGKERDVVLKDAVKLLKKSKRLLGVSLLDAQEEVSLEAIAVLRKSKRFIEEVEV